MPLQEIIRAINDAKGSTSTKFYCVWKEAHIFERDVCTDTHSPLPSLDIERVQDVCDASLMCCLHALFDTLSSMMSWTLVCMRGLQISTHCPSRQAVPLLKTTFLFPVSKLAHVLQAFLHWVLTFRGVWL